MTNAFYAAAMVGLAFGAVGEAVGQDTVSGGREKRAAVTALRRLKGN